MLNDIKLLCECLKRNSDDSQEVPAEVKREYLRIFSFLIDFFFQTAVLVMALFFSSLAVTNDDTGTRNIGFDESVSSWIQYIISAGIFVITVVFFAIVYLSDKYEFLVKNGDLSKICKVLALFFVLFLLLLVLSAYIAPIKYSIFFTLILWLVSIVLSGWKDKIIAA